MICPFPRWKYSPSFRPSFVNCCPSNLLSAFNSSPSPLPSENKYTLYTYTMCKGYGVLDFRQIKTCRKVPLQMGWARVEQLQRSFDSHSPIYFSKIILIFNFLTEVLNCLIRKYMSLPNSSEDVGSGNIFSCWLVHFFVENIRQSVAQAVLQTLLGPQAVL